MSVKTKIVISANEWETRVGIIEDDRLVEFYVEREESRNLVGRVYKGRVENVVPGLRGAFIHIGLRKNGFLPLNEIPEFEALDDEDEGKNDKGRGDNDRSRMISLKENEDILVQVVKDPFAEKGARLTSYVSIPGRYLVYFPNAERVGISRRIFDRRERSRLRAAARKFKSRHAGLIIRTVAAKAKPEELADEYRQLERTWEQMRDRAEAAKPPAVVYDEPSIGVKLVRDIFTGEVEKVVVDSEERHREILDYLDQVAPRLKRKVELYRGEVPLLEQAGVEAELDRVFQKRLWLKSGGFITIDQTEAMVAIDVNTGRSAKEDDPEKLIFSTNIEAAAEIARQIRLRDLAGLIIVDFIDMNDQKNIEKVVAELRAQLANDRAKADYSRMSRFGLLEMTRERTRPGMMYAMCETCPTCKGSGRVRSRAEVAMKIERAILAKLPKIAGRRIRVMAAPWITDYLTADWYDRLAEFAKRYRLAIDVKTDFQIQPTDFRLLVEYAE
ncbi:MAG TPA: Rne/Rng family ribonuclease [candidate division WOR-3 bacterium]|uniref:Ribonuclease G n=1 Tax=candidate division WOR-3 bacterium TaxID=2052148 RepID=A0A7V0XE51_UNCW3|nr:Rne/Rng family ribonuclease [candidate division WOR-3 bacterium]